MRVEEGTNTNLIFYPERAEEITVLGIRFSPNSEVEQFRKIVTEVRRVPEGRSEGKVKTR